MTTESSGNGTMKFLKLVAVIILTLVPLSVIIVFLTMLTNLPGEWLSACLLFSAFMLLVGWCALIYAKHVKGWLYILAAVGTALALTLIASGFVALGTILGPLTGPVSAVVLVALYTVHSKMKQQETSLSEATPYLVAPVRALVPLARNAPRLVAGVEIDDVPKEYVNGTLDKRSAFESILRHANHSGVPMGLRLLAQQDSLSVVFTTWADDEATLDQRSMILLDTVRSNLPEFGARYVQDIPAPQQASNLAGGTVTGVPKAFTDEGQIPEGIGATASLLKELGQGLLQITIEPRIVDRSEINRLESAYRRASQASETTISRDHQGFFSKDEKESRTEVNVRAKREAEKIHRQIERLSNSHLCRVRVNILSWGIDQQSARQRVGRLASSLVGTLRPDDPDNDFKAASFRKESELAQSLQGLPVGNESVLTLDEAVNYLMIPQCDMGLRVSNRTSFTTATEPIPQSLSSERSPPEKQEKRQLKWRFKPGVVALGHTLTLGGTQLGNIVWFLPSDLDSHVGIHGDTRSGKTKTSILINAQLVRGGVNPLLIVPFKPKEHRVLADISDEWRIYSVGNPDAAPLAYNGFNLPTNVLLSKWIPRVIVALCSSMPNSDVVKMHVDDVVRHAFRKCGWDVRGNKVGRPVMLRDLWDAMVEVSAWVGYGQEVHQNIGGALESRLRSLIRNPVIVSLFNTKTGITVEELLAHPTIIEIDRLSYDDKQLFMALLTAAVSEYYLANPRQQVENVLVLEEAHILLRRSKSTGDDVTSHDEVITSINEMLRTIGGTGLGLITMEQMPSTMDPESLRLPVSSIIHSLTAEQERRLAAGLALCSEEQMQHIAGMKKGEAIVFLERDKEPKDVQIFRLEDLFEDLPPLRDWTDELLREYMAPVYAKAPHINEYEDIPDEFLLEVLTERVKPAEASPDIIDSLIANPKFLSTLTMSLDSSLSQAEHFLRRVVEKIGGTEDDGVLTAQLLQKVRPLIADKEQAQRIDQLLDRAGGEAAA